jgi:hypothetical protein
MRARTQMETGCRRGTGAAIHTHAAAPVVAATEHVVASYTVQ